MFLVSMDLLHLLIKLPLLTIKCRGLLKQTDGKPKQELNECHLLCVCIQRCRMVRNASGEKEKYMSGLIVRKKHNMEIKLKKKDNMIC